MFESGTEHCRIVKDALEGKRAADERTFESLSVLDERLRDLKKLDKLFDDVEFSSAVRKLLEQKETMIVC